MTTISEKLAGTQSGSIDPTGARTLTKVFDVIGAGDLQTAIQAMNTEVVIGTEESVGVVWDIDGNQYVTVYATYYGQKSWTHADGDNDHWIFTLTYSTAPSASGGTDSDGDLLAVVTTQGTTSATTKSVYRIMASGTSENDPMTTVDIGGKPVDIGGEKTSVVDIDRRFSVTEKMWSFPNVGGYSLLSGTRNAGSYEGGAIGTILYLSFSWSRDSSNGLWSVTHNFSVDASTFHAEQVAKTDPQGDVIKSKTINSVEYDSYHAATVVWRQPFELHSFDGLPTFMDQ